MATGQSLKFWTDQSRADDAWETPLALFQRLNIVFEFQLDVCATRQNAKCPRFFSPEENGLAQPWRGRCWMNPPYGRGIEAWIQKAYEEAAAGHALVVGLIPAKTDTGWWHDFVAGTTVHLFRRRLRFNGSKTNAPFASALAIWWPSPGAGYLVS